MTMSITTQVHFRVSAKNSRARSLKIQQEVSSSPRNFESTENSLKNSRLFDFLRFLNFHSFESHLANPSSSSTPSSTKFIPFNSYQWSSRLTASLNILSQLLRRIHTNSSAAKNITPPMSPYHNPLKPSPAGNAKVYPRGNAIT